MWFRDDRVRSPFQPQTGLRVVAHGRVDVYEAQGALQLYVDSIQPSGVGDLAIQFEQLKAKLAAEGLFATERKRPLPARPKVVAVVSSPTGAAWKDVCHVFARRWPLVARRARRVPGPGRRLAPSRSFGRCGGSRSTSRRSRSAGRADEAPAVTIVARGGGSMEDLWSFNDERVVRAIVAHTLPVVSGVGHEVDVTLTDFAADVRAATPTAAAELVVPGPGRVRVGAGARGGADARRGRAGRGGRRRARSSRSGACSIG